jgi:hypothetical protein
MKKLFLLWTILFFSLSAEALIYIRPSFSYLIDNEDEDTRKEEVTQVYLDMSFGWAFTNGFSLGGIVASEKQSNITTIQFVGLTTTTTLEASRSSKGATIGWLSPKENGFFIFLTYFLESEFTPDISSTTVYEGTGYQAEIGYFVKVKKIGFGAHLSYKNFTYDNQRFGTTNTALDPNYTYTDLVPMIDLWFMF